MWKLFGLAWCPSLVPLYGAVSEYTTQIGNLRSAHGAPQKMCPVARTRARSFGLPTGTLTSSCRQLEQCRRLYLKAARAPGLKIPEAYLLRADLLIE
jgi:hypothetical protein